MLRRQTANRDPRPRDGVPRRDVGTTFVEVLVAIVLLGIGGVATLTALTTSIRGSDQHKSKVAALAELQGAGAFLQREANELDCTSPTLPDAAFYQDKLDVSPGRPGVRNEGVVVTVLSVDCSSGLPVATLEASHEKGNATEVLDVAIGGVSVDKLGTGSGGPGGPGPGPCTWDTATATPVSVNKSGNSLVQSVNIRLSYTGDCSGASASALLSQPAPSARSITLTMNDSTSGLFEANLAPNAVNWKKELVTVTITTSGPSGTFTTSFTVT